LHFLLGATAEVLRANMNWKSAISLQRARQISGRRGRPNQSLFSQN